MSRGVSRFPRVHSLRSHMHTQRVEYVRTKLESYTFIFAATCILLIGNGEKSLFALAGNSTQKKKMILGLSGTFCTLQTKLVDHATSNKLGLRRVATVTASVLWILMLCRYGSLSNTFTKFKCGRSSVSFLWRIYGCYFLLVQVR